LRMARILEPSSSACEGIKRAQCARRFQRACIPHTRVSGLNATRPRRGRSRHSQLSQPAQSIRIDDPDVAPTVPPFVSGCCRDRRLRRTHTTLGIVDARPADRRLSRATAVGAGCCPRGRLQHNRPSGGDSNTRDLVPARY